MRKIIAFAMLLSALAMAVFLAYRIYAGVLTKREIANRIGTLPEFHFSTLDKKPFQRAHLPKDMPAALLYFNTDCPHCGAELDDILSHPTLLDSVYFLMISKQKPERLTEFVHLKNLASLKNIAVVTDAQNRFPEIFGTTMVPVLFVYGKDRRLVKIFKGETSAEAIRRTLFTDS